MAQAARLNLRMQKELKLLLTDPPHGATFPHLSDNSLTSIVALIQGPEGTVYQKGFFKINIQIPERYPFQPPVVTFSTPIYHPNIDTGGRICLDILNLPPKGAWQPSLNISTVLTSIGLLLSEPNPDDGLMCEASKEYKYNKQVFDQKARSMTEKYAKADASPSHGGLQSLTDPSTIESKAPEVVKTDAYESTLSFKKISGISRKLSLNASGSNTMEGDFEMKEAPSNTSISELKNQEPNEDSEYMAFESVTNSGHDHDKKLPSIGSKKLCLSRKNLQKEVPDSTKRLDDLTPSDFDVQKENQVKVQHRNQDSKEAQFEHSKPHVMSVSKSADNQDNKPRPAISSKKLCLSRKNLQKEVPDSTKRLDDLMPSDLDVQKENLVKVLERNQDSKEVQFEHSKTHVTSVSKSAHNQDSKPRPAISSKKLCLSNKSLQKEVPDSTNRFEDTPGDLDAQKVNMPDVKRGSDMHGIGIGRKLDASGSNTQDRDIGLKLAPSNESLECSKDHVMNVKNSDHGQHTKRPIISSKKLCLSNKNLQKEVPGPTKRVDDVLPRDIGARMENLLEAQKETDIPEYAVGSKRLSGISRKLSLDDASGSNTRVSDTGMSKTPFDESQIKNPNQDSKDMSFEHSIKYAMPVMNSGNDQGTKSPAGSSKKLRLSNKNLSKEDPDATKRHDVVMSRAQKEVLLEVQKETDMPDYSVGCKRLSGTGRKLSLDVTGSNTRDSDMGINKAPNQDFKELPFEYSKNQAMTMMNSDHDQGAKPPAVSSKKLCLSSKNLQKDSTKRKVGTTCTDLDAQKENLLEAQTNSTDTGCTAPKRKKLGLTGKRPSFGFPGLTKNRGIDNNVDAGGLGVNKTSKAPQANQKGENSKPTKLQRKPLQVLAEKDNSKLDLKADGKMHNSKHNVERSDEDISEQGLGDPEGVVVLDSEDSEEEMPRSTSRRLISRRRLVGKI